jgi:hypothetical protein
VYSLKSVLYESLKNYKYMRPYTKDEIKHEVEEYHKNKHTKSKFPGMWKDNDDVEADIKTAPYEYPSDEELKSLENSDVGDILELPPEDRMKRAVELAKGYHKDYKQIIDGLKKKTKFPAPVIIKDKSGRLYLLGGNTRLMLGVAMGYNLPVKMHSWKKDMK